MIHLKDLITIVIPCKNEGMTIKKTLQFLNSQIRIYDTRVIIADVSDDNEHTKYCIESQEGKNLNIDIIEGGFPAVGRNAGAKLVTTPYVLFLDADIFLIDDTLLFNLMNIVSKKKTLLSTCKFRTTTGEFNYVYKAFDYVQWFTKFSKPFAIGGFMLFDTIKFNELGGFNKNDKFAEDYHISMKISPKDFYIHDEYIYTSPRRFKSKGLWYMIKMMILSYFNRNNEVFFTHDHNYWK